jgi:hypothetical protein
MFYLRMVMTKEQIGVYLHDFRILPWALVSLHATTFALARSTKKLWQLTEQPKNIGKYCIRSSLEV